MAAGRRLWGLAAVLLALGGMGGAACGQSDNCEDAPPLPMGFTSMSVEQMTLDGVSACEGGSAGRDVWFSFTPDREGTLLLSVCSGLPCDVGLYTGCPGNLDTMLACNQLSPRCSGGAHLEWQCVAGRRYLVRLNGHHQRQWNYTLEATYQDPRPARRDGPDVAAGGIPRGVRYADAAGFSAFAFQSTACSVGTADVNWTNRNDSPNHPVISTSLYRIEDGVFEQLGYGWVKHGFAADYQSLCDQCPTGGDGTALKVGCSDTYLAEQNGIQSDLWRRSEVNPTTGVFPYPPLSRPPVVNATSRRVRVPAEAVDVTLHPAALYLTELQFVAADDARAGNAFNNVSHVLTEVRPGTTPPRLREETERFKPAISGWAQRDPSVQATPLDFDDQGYACRVWVASRAAEVSPGVWRYVYAVFNLNADRAVAGFILPRLAGASASAPAVRTPAFHADEVYSATPWAFSTSGGEMGWRSAETYQTNPNGNAIWWGMTYTMVLTSTRGPDVGTARLPLYKPGRAGEPVELSVRVPVPGHGPCMADFNGDGSVDTVDYGDYVAGFERGAESADLNGDGFLDFFDYDEFAAAFGRGC